MISSTSADKAKYKQMIIDWIVAFCILLFMHFIMAGTINIVGKIDEMLAQAANVGTGIDLDQKYGNVTYLGHNERLPGTSFDLFGIRNLLSKYGIDVKDIKDMPVENGIWNDWYVYDANRSSNTYKERYW